MVSTWLMFFLFQLQNPQLSSLVVSWDVTIHGKIWIGFSVSFIMILAHTVKTLSLGEERLDPKVYLHAAYCRNLYKAHRKTRKTLENNWNSGANWDILYLFMACTDCIK